MQPDRIGGRYRIDRAIGQGGMGEVWLGRDETLRREVAIKRVGLAPGASATDSARALREARSSAGLSHRNVVTVYDVLEEDDQIWLVMEFVPGRSLSEIIKQDGPVDPAVVADIGAQVADGLAAAHAAGTTHRDVKPGNVLVSAQGVAKISDFGIARIEGDPALTQSGLVSGTPGYFSPQLARGGAPGPADDVWALGATLYAAVEGHPAYRHRTNPVAVLHDIASGPPPDPQRAGFLAPALERMMDRDPASRWAMADAAHVLRRLATEHAADATREQTVPGSAGPVAAGPASSGPPDRDPPAPTPAPVSAPAPAPTPVAPPRRPLRRSRPVAPTTVGLLALVLVLVLAGGAWWLLRDEGGTSGAGTSATDSGTRDSTEGGTGGAGQDEGSGEGNPARGPARSRPRSSWSGTTTRPRRAAATRRGPCWGRRCSRRAASPTTRSGARSRT